MCPRNMGVINNSNGEGTNGDPGCWHYLTIYIRVENKKHCSNLGVAALRNSIDDYYKRKI